MSRKEAEPRWDLEGPSIGGPLALIRSPWKVLPRVCGLRRGGWGSSGGCTTIRGISGLVPPRTPASCWDSKMAWAPGRRACGRGAGPGDDLGSWASWILISRCRSRSDRATLCTCGEQLMLTLPGLGCQGAGNLEVPVGQAVHKPRKWLRAETQLCCDLTVEAWGSHIFFSSEHRNCVLLSPRLSFPSYAAWDKATEDR